MIDIGRIADVRNSEGVSQLVTDFGVVDIPPKLNAELDRLDKHIKGQMRALAAKFVAGEPLVIEDLD